MEPTTRQTLTGVYGPIEPPSTHFTGGKTEARRSTCSWGSDLGQPDSRVHVFTAAVLGFPNIPRQEGEGLRSGGWVPPGSGSVGGGAAQPLCSLPLPTGQRILLGSIPGLCLSFSPPLHPCSGFLVPSSLSPRFGSVPMSLALPGSAPGCLPPPLTFLPPSQWTWGCSFLGLWGTCLSMWLMQPLFASSVHPFLPLAGSLDEDTPGLWAQVLFPSQPL